MVSASERIKDWRTGTGTGPRGTRTAGHRHRRVLRMEGDPSVRVLDYRDGMVLKWEQAHTLDWDETGGFAPAARYNSTTGQGQQHPPLPPGLRRQHPA